MNNRFYLATLDYILFDEKKYFSSYVGNALFVEEKGIVNYECVFPQDPSDSIILHNGEIRLENEIVFIPSTSEYISFYNPTTEKFRQLYVGRSKGASFGFAEVWDNSIYFFPVYYGAIVKVDYKNFSVTKIEIDSNIYKKYKVSDDALFGPSHVRIDDRIFVPFCNSHAIMEFDMEKETYRIYDVGSHGYGAICRCDDTLWLAPRVGSDIIGWNYVDKSEVTINELPENYNGASFLGAFNYGKDILFFPERANMVLRLNTCDNSVKEEEAFSEMCVKRYRHDTVRVVPFISARMIKDSKIFLCSGFDCSFIEYDLETGIYNKTKYESIDCLYDAYKKYVEEKYIEYIMNSRLHFMELYKEALEDFIDVVTHK